jgi:hypothetical protein
MMADEDKKTPPCHVVIMTSDGDLNVETLPDLPALAVRLKELIDHDVSVFAFSGDRLHISKPPLRYLMTPEGNIPLFDVKVDNLEPDDTGYLGVDPIHLEKPPQIKIPAPKPVAAADEFFDDNSGDALGVFDSILPDPDS